MTSEEPLMNNKELGQRIKEYRTGLNLTQQQLADMVNISAKTVSHWETGYTLPDVNTLVKLTEIFHISLNEFVGNNKDLTDTQILASYTDQYIRKTKYALMLGFAIIWVCLAGLLVVFEHAQYGAKLTALDDAMTLREYLKLIDYADVKAFFISIINLIVSLVFTVKLYQKTRGNKTA